MVILKIQNHLFLRYIICLAPNPFKKIQEYQHSEDSNFHKMKYDQGHINAKSF